jgi:hypothetical protein
VNGDVAAVLDDERDEQANDDGQGHEPGDLAQVALFPDRQLWAAGRTARRAWGCALLRRTLGRAIFGARGSPPAWRLLGQAYTCLPVV